MKRLIKDASKMTEVQKQLNVSVKEGDMSFGNIVNAISVMQKSMDIAGTTSKEASETIQGSLGSLKAAFTNFLGGAGGSKEVIDTLMTFGKNVGKAIEKMAPDLIDGIIEIGNAILKELPKVINKMLPLIINGALKLVDGIVSALPQIIQAISLVLPQIITTLAQMAPVVLQQIINVIPVIATALAENLPTLIPVIVQGIISCMQVFNDNMGLFIKAGLQIVLGLIKGLINSIPLILKNLGTIIEFMLNFFSISKLVGGGIKLIKGLGNGLIKAIPMLLKNIPKIIGSMGSALKTQGIGALKSIGINLIKGLWNGMGNMKSWIISKIKGLGKSIIGGIKDIFGIHSPSKVMFEIGGYLDKGFINGVEGMKDEVKEAFNGTFGLSSNMVNSASANFSPNVNVVNNISMEQDPLGQMVRKVKTFSGGAKNDFNYGMGV